RLPSLARSLPLPPLDEHWEQAAGNPSGLPGRAADPRLHRGRPRPHRVDGPRGPPRARRGRPFGGRGHRACRGRHPERRLMARVVPIGEPQNQVERDVIAHLRDSAPDSWTVIHNFELPEHGTWYEVDLAVLTPRAVFLVDVKGVHGKVEVNGRRWYPQFGAPYASPLLKLRQHARALKSRITEAHPARSELRGLYVGAAVI